MSEQLSARIFGIAQTANVRPGWPAFLVQSIRAAGHDVAALEARAAHGDRALALMREWVEASDALSDQLADYARSGLDDPEGDSIGTAAWNRLHRAESAIREFVAGAGGA